MKEPLAALQLKANLSLDLFTTLLLLATGMGLGGGHHPLLIRTLGPGILAAEVIRKLSTADVLGVRGNAMGTRIQIIWRTRCWPEHDSS
jgi:hypothetical protein